jgi:hypothetical protein
MVFVVFMTLGVSCFVTKMQGSMCKSLKRTVLKGAMRCCHRKKFVVEMR